MPTGQITQQQFEANAALLVQNGVYPDMITAEAALIAQGAGPEAQVFMGGGPTTGYGRSRSGYGDFPTHQANPPIVMTVTDANFWLQQQAASNTADWQRIHKEMMDAGLVTAATPLPEIMNVWANYVTLAANAYTHNPGSALTPEHFLTMFGAMNSGAGKTTTRSTSTSKPPSIEDLRADYQSVAQQALGRRATSAEAQAAATGVQAQYAANPASSTTTSTTDRSGNTTSSTTGTPGFGSAAAGEAFLQNAMSSKDYGAYQAAGRFFPVLMNALQAVSGIGA